MKKSILALTTLLLLSQSAFGQLKCKAKVTSKDVTTEQSSAEKEGTSFALKFNSDQNLVGFHGTKYSVRVEQNNQVKIKITSNNGNSIERIAPANKKVSQSLKLKFKEGELKFEESVKVKCKKK